MHEHDLGGAWRNELLAVNNEHGERQALIERAAVRPLGIATVAVHLVGHTGDGRVWVQQRAFDKATDPGQWDTLSGGMLSASETVASALHRETWEEAGLEVATMRNVRALGHQWVRRPVDGNGYMVERIEMFEGELLPGLDPDNQDGEVEGFDCVPAEQLLESLKAGVFTLEAALVHAHWLRRHQYL
jgi:8-oxo-dGTP pyrophosphatase MutT (NUDIX family)